MQSKPTSNTEKVSGGRGSHIRGMARSERATKNGPSAPHFPQLACMMTKSIVGTTLLCIPALPLWDFLLKNFQSFGRDWEHFPRLELDICLGRS